jgi:PAS domain S-box-containing protein
MGQVPAPDEPMLRALLAEHTDYVCVLDATGMVLWGSQALKRVFGWEPSEHVGRPAIEFLHPDDIPPALAVLSESVSKPGQRLSFEFRMRCKDGSYREAEAAGTNLLQDPTVRGIIISIRDVTDRRRQLRYARAQQRMAEATASLDEPREMLDALVREIGEALALDRCLILDIDSTRKLAISMCEWLNPHNPQAFSVKRDYPLELFRESWSHFWNQRTRIISHAGAWAEPLTKEGSAAFVHQQLSIASLLWHPFCFRADGYFLLVLNQVSRRRDWLDDEVGFVEAAAAQATVALQKRQILAEHLLAEEQLRQSQKMEAIGRLAGGIAHDFNNLLTAIIGYADLLKSRMTEHDPLRRHVDGILQVADRAAATTHQLLSFSRRQVLKPKVLDLNALVSQLEGLLRRLIGENIELVVRRGDGTGHVRIDPGQLELALVNLAVNARDAMPQGGQLTMETSLRRVDGETATRLRLAPGSYACVGVRDTGVGMDADTRLRLFEPFFTTKELGKGTGLGLSSVYGIINAAGGGIDVDSAPAHGSTFTIYLPREASPDTTPSRGVQLLPADGGAETVLMVEDDDTLRELLGDALSARGYRVLVARDGAEGLRVAAQEPSIDLVLSDVVMPRMNGPAMARSLKRTHPSARLLFMSGYTADAFANEPELAQSPVIAKPFAIDELIRTVRTVLDASVTDGPRG